MNSQKLQVNLALLETNIVPCWIAVLFLKIALFRFAFDSEPKRIPDALCWEEQFLKAKFSPSSSDNPDRKIMPASVTALSVTLTSESLKRTFSPEMKVPLSAPVRLDAEHLTNST
jgi:hypothetical protein